MEYNNNNNYLYKYKKYKEKYNAVLQKGGDDDTFFDALILNNEPEEKKKYILMNRYNEKLKSIEEKYPEYSEKLNRTKKNEKNKHTEDLNSYEKNSEKYNSKLESIEKIMPTYSIMIELDNFKLKCMEDMTSIDMEMDLYYYKYLKDINILIEESKDQLGSIERINPNYKQMLEYIKNLTPPQEYNEMQIQYRNYLIFNNEQLIEKEKINLIERKIQIFEDAKKNLLIKRNTPEYIKIQESIKEKKDDSKKKNTAEFSIRLNNINYNIFLNNLHSNAYKMVLTEYSDLLNVEHKYHSYEAAKHYNEYNSNDPNKRPFFTIEKAFNNFCEIMKKKNNEWKYNPANDKIKMLNFIFKTHESYDTADVFYKLYKTAEILYKNAKNYNINKETLNIEYKTFLNNLQSNAYKKILTYNIRSIDNSNAQKLYNNTKKYNNYAKIKNDYSNAREEYKIAMADELPTHFYENAWTEFHNLTSDYSRKNQRYFVRNNHSFYNKYNYKKFIEAEKLYEAKKKIYDDYNSTIDTKYNNANIKYFKAMNEYNNTIYKYHKESDNQKKEYKQKSYSIVKLNYYNVHDQFMITISEYSIVLDRYEKTYLIHIEEELKSTGNLMSSFIKNDYLDMREDYNINRIKYYEAFDIFKINDEEFEQNINNQSIEKTYKKYNESRKEYLSAYDNYIKTHYKYNIMRQKYAEIRRKYDETKHSTISEEKNMKKWNKSYEVPKGTYFSNAHVIGLDSSEIEIEMAEDMVQGIKNGVMTGVGYVKQLFNKN